MSGKGYLDQPHLHAKAPYRAASLSYPANFRRPVQEARDDSSKALFGVAQGIPSVALTKLYASTKPDHIWFDVEHAMWGRESLNDAIQAAHTTSEGRTMTIVRVPGNDDTLLTTALDAGAAAIIIPHTESAAQIQAKAQKIYYPPKGHRSLSPWISAPGVSSASLFDDDMFCLKLSNEHVGIIAQIESVEGLKKVEEIAACEHTTALMFGPADYANDAGIPIDLTHPGVMDAAAKVCAAGKKYGKPLFGPGVDPSKVPSLLDMGFRVLNTFYDVWDLSTVVNDGLQKGRQQAQNHGNQEQANGEPTS